MPGMLEAIDNNCSPVLLREAIEKKLIEGAHSIPGRTYNPSKELFSSLLS